MILEKSINYLNGKLDALGYASALIGLCRKVADDKGVAGPKQYCSGGEFKAIDPDYTNGTSYWRRISDPVIAEASAENSLASCELPLQITERLRLVMYVPKAKLTKDDSYCEERIATTVIRELTTRSAAFKNLLSAKSVALFAETYKTEGAAVLAEEYDDIGRSAIRFEIAYLAIDFTLTIIISRKCLPEECS